MYRSLYFAFILLLVALSRADAVQELEDDSVLCECKALRDQVKGLQKNITELWTYVFQLRNAMAAQLKHLKEHQVQTEMTLEHMAHHSGHGADSYHKQERQESHDHDHYAEESSHHGDHEHHHHHEESSHHEDHDKHGDDSSHHGDHDDHHHHDDHHDDHHHHDDDHSQGSSSHSHSHEETDHHHHHDDSHEHTSKEKKEEVAEEVVVATVVDQHRHHGHVHDMRSLSHSHGHHSHHDHGSHTTNKTVFPMTSEYDQYKFATCAVESNKALPAEAQQDVRGEVTFWQLKTGGPLGIHVRLQGFKMNAHHGHGQHHQTNEQEEQQVEVPVANQVTMVHKHGLHVHADGDMSNGCQSMGPHYNPHGVDHKGPTSPIRHVGDLGNIECDDHGFTNIAFSDSVASLIGPYAILNRGLVVHADPDDYGRNLDDPESLKTGNAGQRIACCVIQEVERPSFKAYRYSKRAKQYQNR